MSDLTCLILEGAVTLDHEVWGAFRREHRDQGRRLTRITLCPKHLRDIKARQRDSNRLVWQSLRLVGMVDKEAVDSYVYYEKT